MLGTVFLAYLGIGVIVLLLFDVRTGRIRKRFFGASRETQLVFMTGQWQALIFTALAVWLFWPVVIYGALEGLWKR